MWERALDRCERVLVAMARLNIDERLVRITEAQGKIVIKVMIGAFADIGLSQEMQEAVRPAIPPAPAAGRRRGAAAGARAGLTGLPCRSL